MRNDRTKEGVIETQGRYLVNPRSLGKESEVSREKKKKPVHVSDRKGGTTL